MEKHVVVYKDEFTIASIIYGPFDDFDDALDFLATLPCAAECEHKYIETLRDPAQGAVPRGWNAA